MRESPKQGTRLLQQLDSVERSVVGVSRGLLWIALLGVLALVAAVIVTRKRGGTTQGEYFYFGVAIAVVLGWITTQFARLRSRVRPTGASRNLEGAGPTGQIARHVRDSGPVPLEGDTGFEWSREFRLDMGPGENTDVPQTPGGMPFTFSHGFEFPLASLPADVVPDDATLDVIAAALERGERLEHLCAAVQPAYNEWDAMARQAYRFLIEAILEDRRRRGGAAEA